MQALRMVIVVGWSLASLVTLHGVFQRSRGASQETARPEGPTPAVQTIEASSAAAAIRSCELPAGTVVFVVREPAGDGSP